jgi:hypothetical protein
MATHGKSPLSETEHRCTDRRSIARSSVSVELLVSAVRRMTVTYSSVHEGGKDFRGLVRWRYLSTRDRVFARKVRNPIENCLQDDGQRCPHSIDTLPRPFYS